MKILKFICNLFISKSVYEQERDYLEKNGYPDETVVFTDSIGRISSIIGKNEFLRVLNSDWHKKIEKEIKEKGYFEINSL